MWYHEYKDKYIYTGEYNMKILSFVGIKGGIGKTTLSYNYGEWLAAKVRKSYLSI